MKIKANAKINLTLDVLGRRQDGYHLIDSVFQSVSVYDEVTVEKADTVTVNCSDSGLSDQSNIAYKASQKFFERTGIMGGAQIYIEKHIPQAAGMGGGSADAAAVIVALDKLYKTNLSKQQLCDIGLLVGADVPFCIVGGTARVGGIGEQMSALPNMPDCAILLIKHGVKLSTADMYRQIDACPQEQRFTQKVVDAIQNADLDGISQNVFNAFFAVCDNTKLITDIKTTSPMAASLSGSGPTVFAIYNDFVAASKASKSLCDMGYNVINATPTDSGLEIE
ncbi:MAG: 4-(cytidine 5'-diphospho)-2-C-methyl-D-erythritol kinase [Clostridia bacterium]|nr:4-(cytidine 5'-diphospho)-2-C-methyl-D-erythritol kinase [Clostridia bacterium]